MSVTQTLNPRSRQLRRVCGSVWFDLAVAAVVPVLVTVSTGVLDVPATVERVTFENPTVYDLSISVSDDGHGWMRVATVGAGSSQFADEVIDQGEAWRFRFGGQARSGGEITISRDDLVASGWHLTIPTDVGERLADAGAPPSP